MLRHIPWKHRSDFIEMNSGVFGRNSEKHSRSGCAFFLEAFKSIPVAVLVSVCCCAYVYIVELVSDSSAGHAMLLLTMPMGCMIIHTINKEKSSSKTDPYLRVATTWVSHFCGASVGKEAVGIGLGKAISQSACERLRIDRKRVSEIVGTASAFSTLFSTPFAGIAFCLEEKDGKLENGDIIFAILAAISAFFVSRAIGMRPIRFSAGISNGLSLPLIPRVAAGCAFSALVARIYELVRDRIRFAFCESDLESSMLLSFLAMLASFASFQVLGNRNLNGLSVKLMTSGFLETELSVQVFCLVMKIALTAICFCAGFTGGDFIPFLILGFLSGSVVANLTGSKSMLIPFFSAFSCLAFGKRIPLTSLLLLSQAFLPDLL